jgi:hypothetical protein
MKLVRRIGPTASVNFLALLKYTCAASALIIDKPIGNGFADVHGPTSPRSFLLFSHRMTALRGGFNRSLQHILRTSQLGSDRARSFGVFH